MIFRFSSCSFLLILAASLFNAIISMPNPTFSDLPYDTIYKILEYLNAPSDVLVLNLLNKPLNYLFSIIAEHWIGSIKKDFVTNNSVVNNKIFLKCLTSSDRRTISPIEFLSILLSHKLNSTALFDNYFDLVMKEHKDLKNFKSLLPLFIKNAEIQTKINTNLFQSFSTDRLVMKHLIRIFYQNDNLYGATDLIFKLFNTMPLKAKQKINWIQFQEAFHIDSWNGVNHEKIRSILNADLENDENESLKLTFSQNQIFILLTCFITLDNRSFYRQAIQHEAFQLKNFTALYTFLLYSFDFSSDLQLFLQQKHNHFYVPKLNFQGDCIDLIHISNIAENVYFFKYLFMAEPKFIPFIFLLLKGKFKKISLYTKICEFVVNTLNHTPIQNHPSTFTYRFDINQETVNFYGLYHIGISKYDNRNLSLYSMLIHVIPCPFCTQVSSLNCDACEYLKSNLIARSLQHHDPYDVKYVLASSYFTAAPTPSSNKITPVSEIDQ